MRNRLVNILSLIMALLIAVSCFGCSSGDDSGGTPGGTPSTTIGNHIREITETDEYLIKNGNTDYSLLVPTGYSSTIQTAVQEFTTFFEQASGIKLNVVEDKDIVEGAKYISIGRTTLLEQKELIPTEDLKEDGFKITTKDSSIFVYGRKDSGTLYGVYDLLTELFNFDAYYWDAIALDKDVTEEKLMNYNIKEIPDFEFRAVSSGVFEAQSTWRRRLRCISPWDYFEDITVKNGIGITHNALLILEQDYYNDPSLAGQKFKMKNLDVDTEYEMYHPEWFVSPKTNYQANNVCLNAGGDADSYELMAKVIADAMIEGIKNSKVADDAIVRMQFSISDNFKECDCEKCLSEIATYGYQSGANIKLLNKISGIIDEWMKTAVDEYKREYEIYFLAYHFLQAPPIKKVDGEDVVTIRCNEKVIPMVAASSLDYLQHIDSPDNINDKNDMAKWQSVADKLFVWTYNANYENYLVMYDTFGTQQDYYRFLLDNNYVEVFEETQGSQNGGSTGFHNLKLYLLCKLQWNNEIDLSEYVDKYFDNFFGPASDIMRQLYNENRAYHQALLNDPDNSGKLTLYWGIGKKENWSKSLLMHWVDLCEKAIDACADVKSEDIGLYNSLYDHIAMERFSFLYMLATTFDSELSQTERKDIRKTIKDDVERIGISNFSQNVQLTTTISDW